MYDDNDATQFDPTPWGSRQRVLPRRAFKAVASIVAPPVAPVPVVPSLAARVAQSMVPADVPSFGTPIVHEADIPTWRVPKIQLYPKPRKHVDLWMWLPIGGLVSIVIIALVGARMNGDVHADATSISAALVGETSDNRFHIVANVEDPPAPPAVELPALHHPIAVVAVKHASMRPSRASNRPRLAVDVMTPLGDLANKRSR